MFSWGRGGQIRSLLWQKIEARALVAARAGRHVDEIVAVEGPLAVVALVAVVGRRHVVLLGGDIRDLPALSALPHVVALATILAGMSSVREDSLEYVARLRRAAVRGHHVTRRARADLALGGVTAKAVVVGSERRRNMTSCAGEVMTRDAPLSRACVAAVVHGVIELHVKALDERRRKRFDLVWVDTDILVADRAHRLRVAACELAQVTSDARLVAREIHLHRLTLAVMTRSAVELLVLGNRV